MPVTHILTVHNNSSNNNNMATTYITEHGIEITKYLAVFCLCARCVYQHAQALVSE